MSSVQEKDDSVRVDLKEGLLEDGEIQTERRAGSIQSSIYTLVSTMMVQPPAGGAGPGAAVHDVPLL